MRSMVVSSWGGWWMGVPRSGAGVWRHARAGAGPRVGTAGHGTTRGGAPRLACLSSALLLGVRSGVEVLDVIGRPLRLGSGVHQQGRVMAQHAHPALEIGRTVREGGVGNAAHAAEKRGPHFRDELFFGVGGIAEATGVRERGAVEPRGVPYRVDYFMKDGGVIGF